MATFLATTDEIKQYGYIHTNVETSVLSTSMLRAQETTVRSALGDTFYDYLINAVATSTTTTADDTLINGTLRNFFRVATEIQTCVYLNWGLRNKNVGSASDEYQTASDFTVIDKLKNDLNKQAQSYKTIMLKFIKDNINDYPSYKLYCNDSEEGDSLDMAWSGIRRRR